MVDVEQVLQDEMRIYGPSFASEVDAPSTPLWTGVDGAETASNDRIKASSYLINYEKPCNDPEYSALSPFHSARSSFASTSNLIFDLSDGCAYRSSLPIGGDASPVVEESLIPYHYRTQESQGQDDFYLKYIDPQLLWVSPPAENTLIESHHEPTVDLKPDLGLLSPPPTTPAVYPNDGHAAATPPSHQTLPPTSKLSAHSDDSIRCPAPSRGRNRSTRLPDSPLHYKKRRAQALETITCQPLYHSLPTTDREYFETVVANLSSAPHLASPQTPEPTIGSLAGSQLVGPRRFTGPGTTANRESVYAVLIDRPAEGAFVCWICGEKRADRRLSRALDHIRGHFEHRPYHCLERHLNRHTSSGSLLPLVSVCGRSFSCAEALKDHHAKMKDKSHTCDTCGNVYTNTANLKRHVRRKHSN